MLLAEQENYIQTRKLLFVYMYIMYIVYTLYTLHKLIIVRKILLCDQ